MTSAIIALIIFYFIFKMVGSSGGTNKKGAAPAEKNAGMAKTAGKSAPVRGKLKSGSPHYASSKPQPAGSLKGLDYRDFEDRDDDWLARQIREEQKSQGRLM